MVHHGNEARPAVEQGDVGPERTEDGCVLAAHRAAAEDHEAPHRLVEIENRGRVEDVGVVEVDVGRVERPGPRGDEDRFGLQGACRAARPVHVHGSLGTEPGVSLYEFDVMGVDVRPDFARHRVDHTRFERARRRLTANVGSRSRLSPS